MCKKIDKLFGHKTCFILYLVTFFGMKSSN